MVETAPIPEPPIIQRMRARKAQLDAKRARVAHPGTLTPPSRSGQSNQGVVSYALEHPEELHAELARRKLKHFLKYAWKILEPKARYVANWHIDAICDHLAAVDTGEIQNLLINIPPRHTKSLTVSVAWPCYRWIKDPETRFLFSSYGQSLATRDALKSRRIIQSPWYQKHFTHERKDSSGKIVQPGFKLTGDQNQKTRYDNDKTGYRISTSVGGMGTGEGGDFVIVDDPHNVTEAESQAVREATLIWWDETMSTRGAEHAVPQKVIIMQRTHEEDLSGHVLEQGGYVHLMLPMEFEPERKCVVQLSTGFKFEDPRTHERELLCPDRVDREAAESLKRTLGSYGTAGQLQQRPGPRGGGMIKIDEINMVESIDYENVKLIYRSWDKAGTEGAGDWTVGTRVGKYKVPRSHGPNCGHDRTEIVDGKVTHYKCKGSKYFIDDVVRGRWSSGPRERRIVATAEKDGKKVRIIIEQEPGSGGKESAEATVARLPNRKCEIYRPTGDKEDRADPMAVAVENGEVDMLIAEWNKDWKAEAEKFPQSKHDDQIDSAAQGFNKLAKKAGVFV